MKRYRWNAAKNRRLQQTRDVGFEDIVEAIASGGLVDMLARASPRRYAKQQLFIVRWWGYTYIVPFVEGEREIFLKTIIPRRKMHRRYREGV